MKIEFVNCGNGRRAPHGMLGDEACEGDRWAIVHEETEHSWGGPRSWKLRLHKDTKDSMRHSWSQRKLSPEEEGFPELRLRCFPTYSGNGIERYETWLIVVPDTGEVLGVLEASVSDARKVYGDEITIIGVGCF